MLTPQQQNYLDNLMPEEAGRIIVLNPYASGIETIAEKVRERIAVILPDSRIEFMGASALKISGQNDIDIYVLVPESDRNRVIEKLIPEFGVQSKNKWSWFEQGFEVSVYVADPESPSQKEQIQVFEILKNNPTLLKEYDHIKSSFDSKTYKEYQTAKYEFYNKLLSGSV